MECILLQKKIGGAEMAEFNGQIVTNEGRNLLSRALAGQGKVIFTKAAFGDQRHSGNLREVTELKNKKIDLAVMNIRNDNGTAVLTVQISNENVEESFRTEEFGVYAKIENDPNEILYSYTTAVEADSFPSNKLGTTYESIHEVYMAISSDTEAEIHVREGIIFLTRDIANQVYTENGVSAVGSLKGRSNLEENKAYSDDLGHWYKNVGGSRSWNKSSTPDEDLIPMTWEYLFSLCKKIKDGLSKLKLTWESIENKPKEFPPSKHKHEEYEPKIEDKKSGYNLDKTDSYEYDLPNKVASGRALYNLWQAARRLTGAIELTWDSITGKPRVFPPQSHYHDDRYSRSEHVHDDRYAGRSHTHDDRYESSFSKNNAFNKNFGTSAGTVMEGSRYNEMFRAKNFVKTVWSGNYLAPNNNTSPLCTLPANWELCIISYRWGNIYNLSSNHFCSAVITKNMKDYIYHAPGSGEWGEARFWINGNNQFISQGANTEGEDCYILKVEYI